MSKVVGNTGKTQILDGPEKVAGEEGGESPMWFEFWWKRVALIYPSGELIAAGGARGY